ncbi:MAG: response regulator transcription factor [Longicatena sp.]
MIKIIIADDQELIRESLKIILSMNKEFDVIDTVESGNAVIESIRKQEPDIILMDVRMPNMDGVQCTKFVKEVYPNIKVIVLTTFDDDEYIFSSIKYGASGYLLKGVSLEELTSAIKTVLQGGAIFNPNVASKVTKIFSQMANHDAVNETIYEDEDLPSLSNTEWKIIQQVSQGLSNKEIADSLKFSEGTIRNYLSVILEKIKLRDRTQLAIWYIHRNKGDDV